LFFDVGGLDEAGDWFVVEQLVGQHFLVAANWTA
jgi:hypothetical protein